MTKNSIEMLPGFEFWLRKFAPDIYIFFFSTPNFVWGLLITFFIIIR